MEALNRTDRTTIWDYIERRSDDEMNELVSSVLYRCNTWISGY